MSKLKSASKISNLTQNKYIPSAIEKKWQGVWGKNKIYSPNLDTAKKPFYCLMMFPYPSAEGMHVGNMYAFTGADVYGRFMRMQGFDVFEPIGLDGFGIHSENYAIKIGRHPKEQAKISEKNFYRQLHATGNGFDWSRKLETYDPKYYKWTQWLFIQLFKAGLAYRKKAPVNFCPSCKTVLADEQVITKLKIKNEKLKITEGINVCERCETEVVKKELKQWFFRITKYADRLLANIAKLDWSEKVKVAQRQWIGRSEGALIEFRIQNSEFRIDVFTTRPDTLFGATFLVLAPDHLLVNEILKQDGYQTVTRQVQNDIKESVQKYVQKAKKKTKQERIAEGKEKAGVFTGLYAINPLNNEKIPVWIADYVSVEYGTGAIMGVPAHDQRDFEFAKKYNLPIRQVIVQTKKSSTKEDYLVNLRADLLDGWPDTLEGNISKQNKDVNSQFKKGMDSPGVEPGRFGVSSQPSKPAEPMPTTAYTSFGTLVNSDKYTGLSSQEATEKIIKDFESRGVIRKEVRYHLRDWLISRQRYWGPPIPMIYCDKCDWQPVPENQLPVLLPDVKDWKPKGTGKSPLASVDEFVNTACPNCGGVAKRETDVSDTFLDSAWYFFRYTSNDIDTIIFDIQRVRKWLPVNMYIGGAEHSVLHLLYSRFITMALKDLGFVSFEEPFTRFYAHGLLVKEGAKMSKSKGNVVIPDEYIKKYGADTLRCYLMFLGPFNQGGDFYDTGIEGMHRFVKRVWALFTKVQSSKFKVQSSDERKKMMHRTIKKVTEDISNLRYNTAIAALMEYYNFLSKQEYIAIEEFRNLLKLLAPFAPHIAEELWEYIGGKFSIHQELFPEFNQNALRAFHRTIAIQINGKLRDTVIVTDQASKNKNTIEQLAKENAKIKKYLDGVKISKVIYVEGKVLNFVVT